jgi:phosphate uptake regulator
MSPQKSGKERESDAVDQLFSKYQEIAQRVENEGKQYAIKLGDESGDVTIKYRLLLRPTARGIMHTLEIMDATEERAAIQIALFGRNWERILNHADRVFNTMSTEKFREISRLLIELSKRLGSRGSAATEVE